MRPVHDQTKLYQKHLAGFKTKILAKIIAITILHMNKFVFHTNINNINIQII